jgi:GTP-binding protein HflX
VLLVFNKIDAYRHPEPVEGEEEPSGMTLDEMKRSWMARGNTPVIFISATNRENISELRAAMMGLIKQMHFIRYPHNQ